MVIWWPEGGTVVEAKHALIPFLLQGTWEGYISEPPFQVYQGCLTVLANGIWMEIMDISFGLGHKAPFMFFLTLPWEPLGPHNYTSDISRRKETDVRVITWRIMTKGLNWRAPEWDMKLLLSHWDLGFFSYPNKFWPILIQCSNIENGHWILLLFMEDPKVWKWLG